MPTPNPPPYNWRTDGKHPIPDGGLGPLWDFLQELQDERLAQKEPA